MVVRLLTKTQLDSILSVSSLYSFNFRTVVQNILILKALLARWTKDSFFHAYFHGLWSICHHNKLATTKLTTTKSRITTGSDLNQTLWVAWLVKLKSNESWDIAIHCEKGNITQKLCLASQLWHRVIFATWFSPWCLWNRSKLTSNKG